MSTTTMKRRVVAGTLGGLVLLGLCSFSTVMHD
ncbi:hypothetical protein BKA03_000477 [Demequina lutea]|uniref:Uncharacterized protein n=1 Tax=Demequina lutea TaxID=431489 RepID=A0A7Y9Z9W7_9MICO|nr:hypothetical protein [Demequina lutea]